MSRAAPMLRATSSARSAAARAAAGAAAERALDVARSVGAVRDIRRARELLGRLTGIGQRSGVLTPRERDVLMLLREGLTNRQIGERLYMSPKTASVHVTALLRKLDVSSRTEAAVRAVSLLDDLAE